MVGIGTQVNHAGKRNGSVWWHCCKGGSFKRKAKVNKKKAGRPTNKIKWWKCCWNVPGWLRYIWDTQLKWSPLIVFLSVFNMTGIQHGFSAWDNEHWICMKQHLHVPTHRIIRPQLLTCGILDSDNKHKKHEMGRNATFFVKTCHMVSHKRIQSCKACHSSTLT